MKDKIIKLNLTELYKFIAAKSEKEDVFLNPFASYNVNSIALLNKIAELIGETEEENGIYYNKVLDANIEEIERLKNE
ncbi:MAG: hypothetical protein EOL97_14520 [Spirochaetia bacterium]|nr:hypothetical protein [Spirochaetia bacterium]